MKSVSNLFHKAAAAFSQPKPAANQASGGVLDPKVPDRKNLSSASSGAGALPVTQRKASVPAAVQPLPDTKSSAKPDAGPAARLGSDAIRELGWNFRKECLARGALVTHYPDSDAAGKPVDAGEAYAREVASLVRDMPQARQPEVAARLVEISRERLNILTMHAAPDFAGAVDTLAVDRLYKDHNLGATLVGLCGARLDPEGLKAGLRSIEAALEGSQVRPLLDHEKGAFIRCMAATLRQSLAGEAQAQSLDCLRQATLRPASQEGGSRLLSDWNDDRERASALRAAGLD